MNLSWRMAEEQPEDFKIRIYGYQWHWTTVTLKSKQVRCIILPQLLWGLTYILILHSSHMITNELNCLLVFLRSNVPVSVLFNGTELNHNPVRKTTEPYPLLQRLSGLLLMPSRDDSVKGWSYWPQRGPAKQTPKLLSVHGCGHTNNNNNIR